MTSGDFHSVPINDIIVIREDRQRRELKGIPELADSIRRLGLIHPPVVQRNNLLLVSGERRLAALKLLGHERITIQYYDEVDEYTRHAIELEENIKRQDVSPQEQCLGVLKYYRYRREVEPDFSQTDAADALGYQKGHVSELLAGARKIEAGDPRCIEAKELSTIFSIVRRDNAHEAAEEQEKWHRRNDVIPIEESDDPMLNLDFNEWAKTYKGERFNFVHCDFPYGIGADKFNQGAVRTHGGYPDDDKVYWDLCESLVTNLDNLCYASCHFMFWFSMHKYHKTLQFFEERSDIKFDPFPLIWVKEDNKGILPDSNRGPRRMYETCLFGSRGDRPIVEVGVHNTVTAATDRSDHPTAKPEPVLHHFFRMFVNANTRMLDPTAGGGTALRAAESLGAKYVRGLENDSGFCQRANWAFRDQRELGLGDWPDDVPL
jgi:ParB/RepB/Spo0J family partition protein